MASHYSTKLQPKILQQFSELDSNIACSVIKNSGKVIIFDNDACKNVQIVRQNAASFSNDSFIAR